MKPPYGKHIVLATWRVGISLVEVYEREGKSVILACKNAQKQEHSVHLRTHVCAYSWNQEKVFF